MLIKSTLDHGVELVTSGQELAIGSTEEPGIWIERHTGRSKAALENLQYFLVGDE